MDAIAQSLICRRLLTLTTYISNKGGPGRIVWPQVLQICQVKIQGCGVGRFFRIPTPTPDSDSSSIEKPTPTPDSDSSSFKKPTPTPDSDSSIFENPTPTPDSDSSNLKKNDSDS